jgi:hypothetical protein
MKNSIGNALACCLLLSGTLSVYAQKVPPPGNLFRKNKEFRMGRPDDGYPFSDSSRSREISIEKACGPNATVYVEDVYRKIIVRTSDGNTVRLMTSIAPPREDSSLTDEEWFRMLNLSLKGNNNGIVLSRPNVYAATQDPEPRHSDHKWIPDQVGSIKNVHRGRPRNGKGELILYIPAGSRLEVESSYGDITIEKDMKELKVVASNVNLIMMNAEKALVRSKYGDITAGNIGNADIEISSGKLTAKNMPLLNIHSVSATVEFGSSERMTINSEGDQYDVDEVGSLHGTKNFGGFRLTLLRDSFGLSGSNGDIRIRNTAPSVSMIRITDKYADLRLPLGSLQNYSVDFDGAGTRITAPFPLAAKDSVQFKTAVGSTSGKHTELRLTCDTCTIDFK